MTRGWSRLFPWIALIGVVLAATVVQ